MRSRKGQQMGGVFSTKGGGSRLALLVLGLLVILPCPERAWGHVTDTMPDAVAEMEYKILLDFQPDKIDVRNKLAMVLYRKGKFKEAEAEYRTVLAVDPANFNALDGLGLVMSQTERVKEAVAQFLAAIKADPQDVMVHYHLGQALAGQGDFPAAGRAFAQALALAKRPSAPATPAADLEAIAKAVAQNDQRLESAVSTPK